MVEFGGWDMPVQYVGIVQEHHNVRTKSGLFDLCHMGRLMFSGPKHREFLHRVLTNNVLDLEPGRARYSLVCNDRGGVLDDILIYADPKATMMVVNAGNRDKMTNYLAKEAASFKGVEMVDESEDQAMIAVQGPQSVAITSELTAMNVGDIPYYAHASGKVGGLPVRVARTGYTGEDGFEFFGSPSDLLKLFDILLDKGASRGLTPVGLGARDTLRLEAGMPLYGHEMDEAISPFEASLGWAVKLKKSPSFVGQEALKSQKAEGLSKVLVGLNCLDKRVPRQGYRVLHNGQAVGVVTSGTASPTLGQNIANALVPPTLAELGSKLTIEIRDHHAPAQVVTRPFYKRS